jgi:Flp pilus assembly protein TadG
MARNRSRFSHIQNEAGSVILTFAISIAALFCFAVVAIDGAILMTTKNQLQCAADAAALAGASAYYQGDNEVRRRAGVYAAYNYAVQDIKRPCTIDTNVDVVIERNTDPPYVQVTTHRTEATGDPLRTYFLKILDVAAGMAPNRPNRVDVTARARANLVDECGAMCIKPWAIPDRWQENSDPPNTTFDPGVDMYDPILTGYIAPQDVGLQITLKQGSPGDATAPGQYNPIDLPPINKGDPITGADQYREWIARCCPFIVGPGDTCITENGNMVGPTNQGIDDLILQDPNAYWDGTKVVSDLPVSPRIVLVPLYDPAYHPGPGKDQVIISKIGAFFIEDRVNGQGSQVVGRFVQVTAPGVPCANNTGQSLVQGLQLIQ